MTTPNTGRNGRAGLWTILIVGAMLAVWLPPLAGASAEETPVGEAPAPEALLGVGDLLGFGANPNVSDCNTYPVDAYALTGLESWTGYGIAGQWTGAAHNGADVPTEMLERAIFEAEGEDWTEVFSVLNKCAKAGGFCACATITASGTLVACVACCPGGTAPYCYCDGIYVYGSCGCADR